MTSPVRTTPAPARARAGVRPAPRPGPLGVANAPRRPDLRVVAEPRGRARTTALVCLVGVGVFTCLLASAVLHAMLVGGQARLDRLDKEIQAEQTDVARAKLALADRQSPERVARAAAARGMVPAAEQHWISAGDGADQVVTGTSPTTLPSLPPPTRTTTPPAKVQDQPVGDQRAGVDAGDASARNTR